MKMGLVRFSYWPSVNINMMVARAGPPSCCGQAMIGQNVSMPVGTGTGAAAAAAAAAAADAAAAAADAAAAAADAAAAAANNNAFQPI